MAVGFPATGGSYFVSVPPDVLRKVQHISSNVQSSMQQLDQNCNQLLTSMNQNLVAEQKRRRDLSGQVYTLEDRLVAMKEKSVSLQKALQHSQSEREQIKAAYQEMSRRSHRLDGLLEIAQRDKTRLQAILNQLEDNLDKSIKKANISNRIAEKMLEETSAQSKLFVVEQEIFSKRTKIEIVAALVIGIAVAIFTGAGATAFMLGALMGWYGAMFATRMKNCPGMTDLYAKQGSLKKQLELIRPEITRLRELLRPEPFPMKG